LRAVVEGLDLCCVVENCEAVVVVCLHILGSSIHVETRRRKRTPFMFPRPPGPRMGTPRKDKDKDKDKDKKGGADGPEPEEEPEEVDLSDTSVVFDAWVQYATYEVRVAVLWVAGAACHACACTGVQ
jgi:hypothetical protein